MNIIEIIWNLPQKGQNIQNNQQLSPSTSSLGSTDQSVRDLGLRVIKLATTCQVLCDLFVEKLGINQEELMLRIQERLNVDPIKKPGHCPTCGQKFHPEKNSCNYCGFIPGS
jgi:rRNA maturation endonuclease Nob1